MKYAFIRDAASAHSIVTLCRVLSVSSSGFYDWLDRPMSTTAAKNRQLTTKIRCFHKASNDIYGAPRLQRDLSDDGEHVSRQRVSRLMKGHRLQSTGSF